MNCFKKLLSGILAGALVLGSVSFGAPSVMAAESGKTGEFTVCSMNVDGLPNKILIVDLNKDGPGSEGTKKISAKMNEYQWDIIGVAEDFNYNTELLSSLKNYKSGTHRGGVSGLSNNTDGLNLIWKNTINVTGEKWTHWTTNYSTGFANTGNGADGMIDKGFRYYQAEIADGVKVDVYILHMDADSDQGDIDAREAQIVQLKNTIIASDNKNPIIVMGDTNCRYTREHLETSFIGGINADPRFTMKDAWIEHIYNGAYPTYGADAIVAKDKGGTYDYPQAEIVDKIFYINNTDSDVTLTSQNYVVNTDFVGADGTALADHWPISVKFTYEKKAEVEEHVHSYTETVKNATCTEDGLKTYTCKCGDFYTEVIKAEGHKFVDGTCTVCEAKDPDYKEPEVPETPEVPEENEDLVLGNSVTTITSGKKYGIVYESTSGDFVLTHENGAVKNSAMVTAAGTKVTEEAVWKVDAVNVGYTISTTVDGKTKYLGRTKTLVNSGYKVALQDSEFVWSAKVNGSSIRFTTKIVGKTYYLRYYTKSTGFIVSTQAAGVTLYELND